jgi:hypothetical protein
VTTDLGGKVEMTETGTKTGLVHLGGTETEEMTTTTEGTHVQYPGVYGWLTHWHDGITTGGSDGNVTEAIKLLGIDDGTFEVWIITTDGDPGIVTMYLGGTDVTNEAGTITGDVQLDGIKVGGTVTTTVTD